MSLRTRLALFFALAIALALLAQGVFGYLGFRQQGYRSLDRDLGVYLAQVRTNLPRERGPRDNPGDIQLLNELFEGYLTRARVVFAGEVVAQQDGFPAEAPLEPRETPRTYGDWRVASLRVDPPGRGPEFFIQGAISSLELTRGLERYRQTILLSVLVVSTAGALAALLLSRPALRPLQHLLATAERVAASGDLSLRVPRSASGELGALSRTFNHMLERLAAFRVRESAFTRNASHELRTPLAAMKLHLSSYREGYAGADETLKVMEEEVERMTRLSEALLTLAREGRTQGVALDLAALAEQEAGALEYRGPPSLELAGDPVLLRQAVANLVENARKHAAGTRVSVELGTRTDGGKRFAVLGVSDNGPGLSPEARGRASEAFYRAPGTRTPGSGLGLAVVAQVARAHGGRLELEPNHPAGLRAELWLELAAPDRA